MGGMGVGLELRKRRKARVEITDKLPGLALLNFLWAIPRNHVRWVELKSICCL